MYFKLKIKQSIILNDIRVLLRVIELEFKLIVFNFSFLFFNLMFLVLDKVDIVLFEALWHIEINLDSTTNGMFPLVLLLVLYSSDLMVSNKLRVLLLSHGEVVVAHPTFVSDLVGDELGVVSGRDALVYQFLLVI